MQIGIRALIPHAKALRREEKTKNKMKTISTIITMASALFFGGTTRKTSKTIFFEIRMDNETNWHPHAHFKGYECQLFTIHC